MNSIKNNIDKNYWFFETKLYTKIEYINNNSIRALQANNVKTITKPDNNVSIRFVIIKDKSIIMYPSTKSMLFKNTKVKVS